ncbi:MAG TPA: VOC family protein [Acidimicrobiia bacterium]|nr:VOC family protein [Acidimicrobiia bacterium]
MRKVVHFELPADDISRAKQFYDSVFGWGLQDVEGMDYTSITTVQVDENQMPTEPGAINGGLTSRSNEVNVPVLTVDVESIEDTLSSVEAAGGSSVRPRTEIPGMGAYAYFRDTEGNVVGLWETPPQ